MRAGHGVPGVAPGMVSKPKNSWHREGGQETRTHTMLQTCPARPEKGLVQTDQPWPGSALYRSPGIHDRAGWAGCDAVVCTRGWGCTHQQGMGKEGGGGTKAPGPQVPRERYMAFPSCHLYSREPGLPSPTWPASQPSLSSCLGGLHAHGLIWSSQAGQPRGAEQQRHTHLGPMPPCSVAAPKAGPTQHGSSRQSPRRMATRAAREACPRRQVPSRGVRAARRGRGGQGRPGQEGHRPHP